nr:zinc ribbon domain-containing protein YjdM [uncultured Deefgea sp.]
MSNPCPQCTLENTYPDGENYVCADCGFEWPMVVAEEEADVRIVKDANGNVLQDGDTVVVAKDLKVKGTSSTLKVGTKIKGIRIVDGDHEIDCKTELGQMMLKACFLKKA